MTSFYSESELAEIGFRNLGKNVLLSKKASIYGAETIEIGDNVRIDDFVLMSGSIRIGNWVHIAAFSALYAGRFSIILNDFVTISSRNAIYAESDDYSGASLTNPLISGEFRKTYGGNIIFEKHTLLGTGCTVLPGAKLGEGASVGAMSLVNCDLGEWTVYAGIPVKRLKERDRNILELERSFLA